MKKAQVIAVIAIKGGTGKTTTAATLAQAAQLQGKKVLIIDLDGQANITHRFGADADAAGAYELLTGGAEISDMIQETAQGIDIIAGNLDLYTLKFGKGGLYTLENAIEEAIKSYDLIIIDTAPALNDLTFNAMQAANGLLISLTADEGSADGLLYALNYAKEIKRSNKKLKVLGCFIAQFDTRPNICRQMQELIQTIADKNKCPYLGEIRRGAAIQEAGAYGKNLFTYAPKSKPAEDYKRLYNAIIK